VRAHPAQSQCGSVSQDWRKPLDEDKQRAYVNLLRGVETAYAMFSVTLDEALGMRNSGRTMKAYQVLSVAPALCNRLSSPMCSLLRSMYEHAKHFGTTPHLAPLDPGNFQSSRSQRAARFNDLFSRILFTRKSQFSHKIATMADLVEELASSFESTTEELCEGQSIRPERDWEMLDAVHYDLNTCLRETVVLFKSFLHALPEGQLVAFQATHRAHAIAAHAETLPARARHLAHRRMALLRGE
jgi:hypothetical protein